MRRSLLLRYFQAHQTAHKAIAAEAFSSAMAEANHVRILLEKEGDLAEAELITTEQIEAAASALVDSCICKGHWEHATGESKTVYRRHAEAVLRAAQSQDDQTHE